MQRTLGAPLVGGGIVHHLYICIDTTATGGMSFQKSGCRSRQYGGNVRNGWPMNMPPTRHGHDLMKSCHAILFVSLIHAVQIRKRSHFCRYNVILVILGR
jgi:hypothetical protein